MRPSAVELFRPEAPPPGSSGPDPRLRIRPVPQLAVIGVTLVVTFLAELPDKTMFASLILGTRYRRLWVWAGAAAAFTVHMVVAVTAGRLLALLPHRIVDAIVAGLFVAGAVYLWVHSFRPQHH